MKKNLLFPQIFVLSFSLIAQERKSLLELQQDFIDLKFGMFIHFNIPTFMNQDWADPDASPSLFNPQKMDCSQWAEQQKQI